MGRSIKKSLALWEKGKELMPRGTQTMSKSPDQFVFGVHPIYLERGNGCEVQDVDGNWYIDYPCALGPILLGYNNKRTIKAVTKQLKKGTTFSLMHPVEIELAELLVEVIPCAEQVRYAKNGTDATLACVRIARSYTGKQHILKPEGHYHGWGDWHAASTTRDYGIPKCLKEYVETFPYNDLNELETKLKTGKFAGLIMEPVALVEPDPGFLSGVRDLCTKHGVVLIFDEMITGFRWSLGGAQEYFGVIPDVGAFGKAVANGMPLSIIAGKREFMKELNHIFFSMTFGGETCSLAAAVETIKELKENREEIYTHVWSEAARLKAAFNEYARAIGVPAEMFGMEPRLSIRFNTDDPSGHRDLFHQELIKRGILFGPSTYITWAHKSKHIEKTIRAIRASLDVVAKSLDTNVDLFLEGQRSMSIFKKTVSGGE